MAKLVSATYEFNRVPCFEKIGTSFDMFIFKLQLIVVLGFNGYLTDAISFKFILISPFHKPVVSLYPLIFYIITGLCTNPNDIKNLYDLF